MSSTKFTPDDEVFRELLKEIRGNKELTQAQVAKKLGVPQSYVSKYEMGERRLDFVETAIVCEALETTIAEFAKLFAARARRKPAK